MDLLRTAVVDITTLVAACRALMSAPLADQPSAKRKLRNRLQHEIRRGTVAYIDALARSKRGLVDDTLLAACRVAAEQRMASAMQHQALLGRIMLSEPGALDGLAAARQDLWRLAHMAIHLRGGMATLRESDDSAGTKSAAALAGRLRRRLRKALIAYARVALRSRKPRPRLIRGAREAALAQIGKRGAAEAERLSDIESACDPTRTLLRRGVTKPLLDLALDWQRNSTRLRPGTR